MVRRAVRHGLVGDADAVEAVNDGLQEHQAGCQLAHGVIRLHLHKHAWVGMCVRARAAVCAPWWTQWRSTCRTPPPCAQRTRRRCKCLPASAVEHELARPAGARACSPLRRGGKPALATWDCGMMIWQDSARSVSVMGWSITQMLRTTCTHARVRERARHATARCARHSRLPHLPRGAHFLGREVRGVANDNAGRGSLRGAAVSGSERGGAVGGDAPRSRRARPQPRPRR